MTNKREGKPIRRFLPNLVTIMAICAGLTSVRMGLAGKFDQAMLLVLLAVLLDAADGRIARYLKSVSPLGAELDTLADFFNFGIAPGLLIYLSVFQGTEAANLGWAAVLILCICCALRLARFNVALASEPTGKSLKFFTGVPAPVLACLALMPMYFLMLGADWVKSFSVGFFFYLLIVGGLAASTLPTFSIKHVRVNSKLQLPLLLAVVLFIILFVVYPWHMLILGNLLYLASIPVAMHVYKNMT